MGGIQLALLLFLLGWERGLSLRCYACRDLERTNVCQIARCPTFSVCYSINMTFTWSSGEEVNAQYKDCAYSCRDVHDSANRLSQIISPETQNNLEKFDVRGVTCCDRDLCNGGALPGRSPWALAGGLLLSLGAACLWALL